MCNLWLIIRINNSAVEDGRHLVHGERMLISSLDSDKLDTGKSDV